MTQSFLSTKIGQTFVTTKRCVCSDKHVFVSRDKNYTWAAPASDTNLAPKQMAPQFVRDYVKHVGLAHVFVARKVNL